MPGCAGTTEVSLGVGGDNPLYDNNPQDLTEFDLNPPGTPGASAPAW
jgi:hypothetical protein